MALTPKQIEEVKKQIFEQTKDFPPERKKQIEDQINKMSPEELEAFVQQQMSGQSAENEGSGQAQAIYRLIVSGEIPAKKIDENKSVITVIDIKPISKGHCVIIPKNPVVNAKDMPSQAFTMAKKITRKLTSKLKAQGSEIQTEFKFGELILNVIPVYDKPVNINSPRYDASEEELEEVHKALKVVKKPKVIRVRKKKQKSVIKLDRRIA